MIHQKENICRMSNSSKAIKLFLENPGLRIAYTTLNACTTNIFID